jgi:hypothetical protein
MRADPSGRELVDSKECHLTPKLLGIDRDGDDIYTAPRLRRMDQPERLVVGISDRDVYNLPDVIAYPDDEGALESVRT